MKIGDRAIEPRQGLPNRGGVVVRVHSDGTALVLWDGGLDLSVFPPAEETVAVEGGE